MTTTSVIGTTATASSRMAGWLALAAAPTFAAMAFASAAGGAPMALCTGGGSPIDGMTAMYLLMFLFHLPPWLTRISRRAARGDF